MELLVAYLYVIVVYGIMRFGDGAMYDKRPSVWVAMFWPITLPVGLILSSFDD